MVFQDLNTSLITFLQTHVLESGSTGKSRTHLFYPCSGILCVGEAAHLQGLGKLHEGVEASLGHINLTFIHEGKNCFQVFYGHLSEDDHWVGTGVVLGAAPSSGSKAYRLHLSTDIFLS